MTKTGGIILAAIGIALLVLGGGAAWMLVQPTPQVSLTQAMIDGVIAVERDMKDLASTPPPKDAGMLDQAKRALAWGRSIDAIEKKHGFTDPIAFSAIVNSVLLVQNGIDPATKTYGGPAMIRKKISELEDETDLSAEAKAPLIDIYKGQLKDALAAGTPPAGNVELVVKNYDGLKQALLGPGR